MRLTRKGIPVIIPAFFLPKVSTKYAANGVIHKAPIGNTAANQEDILSASSVDILDKILSGTKSCGRAGDIQPTARPQFKDPKLPKTLKNYTLFQEIYLVFYINSILTYEGRNDLV